MSKTSFTNKADAAELVGLGVQQTICTLRPLRVGGSHETLTKSLRHFNKSYAAPAQPQNAAPAEFSHRRRGHELRQVHHKPLISAIASRAIPHGAIGSRIDWATSGPPIWHRGADNIGSGRCIPHGPDGDTVTINETWRKPPAGLSTMPRHASDIARTAATAIAGRATP